MTPEDVPIAMSAIRQAWQYTPMHDIQRRQFERLLLGYPTEIVRGVIDDLIHIGATRPGPAEFGELLRSKSGLRRPGDRVGGSRADEHYLSDEGWSEGDVPAAEEGWLEAAADARRRLKGSTETEKAEAQNHVAQKHARNEIAARPEWWGRETA